MRVTILAQDKNCSKFIMELWQIRIVVDNYSQILTLRQSFTKPSRCPRFHISGSLKISSSVASKAYRLSVLVPGRRQLRPVGTVQSAPSPMHSLSYRAPCTRRYMATRLLPPARTRYAVRPTSAVDSRARWTSHWPTVFSSLPWTTTPRLTPTIQLPQKTGARSSHPVPSFRSGFLRRRSPVT
jgi:hypothetical protein